MKKMFNISERGWLQEPFDGEDVDNYNFTVQDWEGATLYAVLYLRSSFKERFEIDLYITDEETFVESVNKIDRLIGVFSTYKKTIEEAWNEAHEEPSSEELG